LSLLAASFVLSGLKKMGEKTSTVTFLPSTSNSSMLSQPQLHDLDVNAPVDESQKEKKQILEPDYNFQCKYCDQNFPALHVLKWHQKMCQGSSNKTATDDNKGFFLMKWLKLNQNEQLIVIYLCINLFQI
jgi:hypothetical protein